MKSRRSTGLLLALLGVLAVGVVYLAVWRPRAQQLSDIRRERDELTQELARLQAAPSAPASPSADPSAPGGLAEAIPDHPELAELLRQLQSIATEAGVGQESVSPSPLQATAGGSGGVLAVDLAISGPKAALYDYLRRLAGLERLFVANTVTIQPATSDATTPAAAGSAPADRFHLDVSGRAFTATVPSGSTSHG
jgi:Tfp pilus assembly protein PilO